MSARTPFVPADSRSDSQTAHVKEQTVSEKTRTQFGVDLSNPLHSLPDTASKTLVAAPHAAKESVVDSFANGPLNTSSLFKSLKRNKSSSRGPGQNQGQTPHEKSSRPDDAPIRSGTADPFSRASQGHDQPQASHRVNALDIISPVARRAILPSSIPFVGNLTPGPDVFKAASPPSGFRMPALPGMHSSDMVSDGRRDAHISNSIVEFSYSNLQTSVESQSSQLPTPPTSTRKGDAPINHNTPSAPQGQITSASNKSALPRRVLLNPDGSRGPPVDEDSRQKLQFFPNKTTSTLKRYPAEADSSDTGPYKRARNEDDSVYGQHAESMTAQPLHHENYPIETFNLNPMSDITSVNSHSSYQYYANNPSTPPNDPNRLHTRTNRQQPPANEPSALDRLLGCDVDAYMDEHLEDYEKSVQRWKQCTVEGWLAGAEEQATRFSKILDFVKDHMTTKMKLFATFDTRVHDHSVTLSEREKSLGVARERLVQESMHVLGTGR